MIKVGDALLQSQSPWRRHTAQLGRKTQLLCYKASLLSIFASHVFSKYYIRIGSKLYSSRKLAKVQKRLLASHYYTTPFFSSFLLCFSSPLLSLIWRRQIQFLSSFYSPTMCGSKHLHIIDIFMECQDRAYITLQKAQRQSREFLYINLLYKKVST